MKVAIFIDSLAIGGAQKYVRQLGEGLSGRGHVVYLFVLNEIVDPLYRDPLQAAGVQILVLGRKGVLNGSALWRTANILAARHFDCVITVLFVSTVFGRLAAQCAGGLPVLTALQARNVNYAWWQKVLLRLTHRLTSWTISNSRSALVWASIHEAVDPARSEYAPNAVDPTPTRVNLRSWAEMGLPELEGRMVIGSLGRLDRQKGYDLLIGGVARLPLRERDNVRVVVFGEGPERGALERDVERQGLTSIFLLPGQRANASDFLSKLDLYVQPSRFEGMPNSIIEALAARVPVLASAVDGVAELGNLPGLELVDPDEMAWGCALAKKVNSKLPEGIYFEPLDRFHTADSLAAHYEERVRAISPSRGVQVL